MRIVLGKGQLLGPISGADEALVTYAAHLRRAGHAVHVLLMYFNSPQDAYYQRLLEAGVNVSWLASDVATGSLRTGRRMARKLFDSFPGTKSIVRRRMLSVVTNMANRYRIRCQEFLLEQRPDIFHVITPDPSAMVMIRASHAAGVPVIYQELGMPYHPPDFRAYYAQFTSILPLCTRIAALSPKLARECLQTLPAFHHLSVLPMISDEPRQLRRRTRSSEEAGDIVTFGFAARIATAKGVMPLIEAFAAGVAMTTSIRLDIAGEGPLLKSLKRRADQLKVASYVNYNGVYMSVDERSDFMRGIDVFVLPSSSEGTPNGIMEAMAHGLPIIATRVGGIPDMVDSSSAILVEPDDTAALSAAIVRLAGDPELRAGMGAAARKRYEQMFSPEAVMPLLLETYRSVVSGKEQRMLSQPRIHPWAKFAAVPACDMTVKQSS